MGVAVKLRWLVEDLTVVMASYDQIKVKRSTTGIGGAYTEITAAATRITLQAGKTLYEHVDADGDATYYYRVTWHDTTLVNPDDDQDPFLGTASTGMYCQVEDLRDEGITVAMLSDARATAKILKWSRMIERWTGRWFEPRTRTIYVDGENSEAQSLGHEIIRIDSMAFIDGRGTEYEEDAITVQGTRIYNRHLTQGLEKPDDRDAPYVEMPKGQWWNYDLGIMQSSRGTVYFPDGRLNLKFVGIFGYTELAPDDSVGETSQGSQIPLSYGQTPDAIKMACMLLVVRDFPQLVDFSLRQDLAKRWAIKSEKTADQSYTLTDPAAVGQSGYWTGDPEIDSIIANYASPLSEGVDWC